MRARERAEDQDQHHQDRAGRQRVAQQRERDVTARELLRHDAGADHGREQERGAERLRSERAAQATASGRLGGLRRRALHAADLLRAAAAG